MVASAAALLASTSSLAAELWTDPAPKRNAVAISSVAPLVDKLEPAVLVIFTETEMNESVLPPGHPPVGPEGMPFPPGMPGGEPPEMRGQGAGFIITGNGYALTNHHVVENALSIRVLAGNDHSEYAASVIGSDEKTDVALIKIESDRKDWPVVVLGDSDALKVGDFVVAIGSPFGLEQSVSLGIVSGRGRKDIAPSGRTGLYDFLQTDASINPGNSGGPLLNLYGEAIGMNSAVNAAGSGIGFAIPINMVKRIIPQLKEKGRFERSWIGVAIQEVPAEMAKGFGLDRSRGALVREVVVDGPAAKAGVMPGDVITAFEGKLIDDSYELPLLAGDAGVGKSVKLDVLRDGAAKTLIMVLGGHPDNAKIAKAPKKHEPAKPKDGSLGVTVVTLDGDDRDRLALKRDVAGTRITKVRPGSPAFMAGLQVDDVVILVNGKETKTANDFASVVSETKAGGLLKVTVHRGSTTVFVPILKP